MSVQHCAEPPVPISVSGVSCRLSGEDLHIRDKVAKIAKVRIMEMHQVEMRCYCRC